MRIPFADRFRRMAANASGLVSTRLSLFSLELQEELERRMGHLALLLAVFMFSACAFLFAAVLILTLAWQQGYLLTAAACLTGLCVVCTVACALCLRHKVQTAPPPFADTLAEFKKDESSLRGHAQADADEKIAREETP